MAIYFHFANFIESINHPNNPTEEQINKAVATLMLSSIAKIIANDNANPVNGEIKIICNSL